MPEKWRPKPTVLSVRRAIARNVLVGRARASYVLGEPIKPIKPNFEEPSMDSIWSWREAIEEVESQKD